MNKLIRNLTITGKRRLTSKQIFIDVHPEEIELKTVLSSLEIDRKQLIDLSMLVGTDYNPGIKGIGPKKALSLIRKHGKLETVMEVQGLEIENVEEIRQIFLEPDVTEDYELDWKDPDVEGILDFLCGGFDFSENRVRGALEKMAEAKGARQQKSLDSWF